MTTPPHIFHFGQGKADGDASMRDVLGGKGANLAEMSQLGLPVPPGFTITTNICRHFNAHGDYPDGLEGEIDKAMHRIGKILGMQWGDASNPLLVAVRSGARVSMPGMMDTVLNLGLNDESVVALAQNMGDARFAWDSYRRFMQLYGDVVMDVPHDAFEDIIDSYKFENNLTLDAEFDAEDWQDICQNFQRMIIETAGTAFPQDPKTQLAAAIRAIFQSWQNPRAITYRRLHNIPDEWGTAVIVQAMVFGNLGDDSATGVAFTRNPSTGEKEIYGEFLVNAQGEDVVAGTRTPLYLTQQAREDADFEDLSMEELMPDSFAELVEIFAKLEARFCDMQDVEFTVQRGTLFILQTRNGQRSTKAGMKIAIDLHAEGLIDEKQALARLDPLALEQLLHPTLDPDAPLDILTQGLPASPGAASGIVALSSERTEALAASGEKVILLRMETSPDDIHGMYAAAAILTSRGGMTSHAAVVARGLGRPCVSGAGEIRIDYDRGVAYLGEEEIREGTILTVDGTSGRVMRGIVPTLEPELSSDFETIMGWADKFRTMGVRANAETPADAARALRLGAEGIGLCRTEHMFFEPSRIFNVQQMILADRPETRQSALDALEPEQCADFVKLFEIMDNLPITIRLLDPPLHEFLPKLDDDLSAAAEGLGMEESAIRARLMMLQETNPMLGHRGCRLAATAPEIYQMQLRAIFRAQQKAACKVLPQVEIMMPLVMETKELERLITLVETEARAFAQSSGVQPQFTLGSMIEVPRAALLADRLAEFSDFFSFGTNDLTQTTFGLSRDDSSAFLSNYQSQHILSDDPFATLDIEGVGGLMKIACEGARRTKTDIKLGLCGEHGGNPRSIAFCQKLGLDYVSCSPFRVPIARLAAAQASIKAT
ncbi:MAG: pyruvate, phosphate dikinase [Parvibaculales bacterium]